MAIFQGTPGNDFVTGTGGDDTLEGLGGDDTLDGLAGDDVFVMSSGSASTVRGMIALKAALVPTASASASPQARRTPTRSSTSPLARTA